MASTTYANFGSSTEAVEVAAAFASEVKDKTILITGVNRDGIGFVTARALASRSPARLILSGRNQTKVEICIESLQSEFPGVDYRFLEVDLSNQSSVREAAATVLAWSDVPTIDIAINNAGVMGIPERTLTDEGVEIHLATNHLGHWLLTCHIMPKLIAAAEGKPRGSVRIVNVSSASPRVSGMRWSDMTFEKQNKDLPATEQPMYQWFEGWGYTNVQDMVYIPLDGYNRSKVANVLFAIGANQRLFEKHGILSLAVHPGVLHTELARNFPQETLQAIAKMLESGMYAVKSLGAGGSTSLIAALDPALAVDVGQPKERQENWGTYLDDCQISDQANALAVSGSEAERLWNWSERAAGERFAW